MPLCDRILNGTSGIIILETGAAHRATEVVIAMSVIRRDIFHDRGRLLANKGATLTPQLQSSLRLRNVLAGAVAQSPSFEGRHVGNSGGPTELSVSTLTTDISLLRAACQDVVDAQSWIQAHPYLRFHLAVLMDHMGWVYTHSLNVATLTAIIALRLGLERSQRIELTAGAMLHDVGTIFIPPEILNKPGALSLDERLVINGHASLGEKMLTRADIPSRVARVVGQHHERWGGQGYPRHLKGPDIDLGAQIVGVADIFDALTSARPHRGAAQPAEAQRLILSRGNVEFHAAIIGLLFKQS